MIKKFLNSQTFKNLQAAFAGESQARNKYSYYASKAKKEGYLQIAKVFDTFANNEKEHAKIWFKLLLDGQIPSTEKNLLDAIAGENYENTVMYKEFAKIAKKEGFNDIAKLFEQVGNIEANHRDKYKKMLDLLKSNNFAKSKNKVIWKCLNCGYEVSNTQQLKICPVCSHDKKYFVRNFCKEKCCCETKSRK